MQKPGRPGRCCLVLLSEQHGDRIFPLAGPIVSIGRRPTCDVSIADPHISSFHAEVFSQEGSWWIRDLASKNGTLVNGQPVGEAVRLRPSDRIELGKAVTLFFSDQQLVSVIEGPKDGTAPTFGVEPPQTREVARRDPIAATAVIPLTNEVTSTTPQAAAIRIPGVEIDSVLRERRAARLEGRLSDGRIAILYQLAEELGATHAEAELVDRALALTLALIPADVGAIFLTDPAGRIDPARPVAARTCGGPARSSAVPISSTIVAEVLSTQAAVATTDAGDDSRFMDAVSVLRRQIRAVAAAPIACKGRTLGVIYLSGAAAGYTFDRSEVLLLAAIGFQTALAVENARLVADLERRVAERTAETERLSQERARLLNMAAHDLKTPLSGIMGYLECLASQAADQSGGARIAGELDVCVEAARSMMDLLTDLLDRQKAEAGRLELSPEPTDVGAYLRGALAIYERWAAGAGRRIELQVRGALPIVELDRRRVSQILNNLVHNALKFTPAGSSVRIEARAVRSEGLDGVEVAVVDEGHGFSAGDTGRILMSFEQGAEGETPATREGHGLGLAIVSTLVELHGGSLAVDGRPGKGARFAFTLPAKAVRSARNALEPA